MVPEDSTCGNSPLCIIGVWHEQRQPSSRPLDRNKDARRQKQLKRRRLSLSRKRPESAGARSKGITVDEDGDVACYGLSNAMIAIDAVPTPTILLWTRTRNRSAQSSYNYPPTTVLKMQYACETKDLTQHFMNVSRLFSARVDDAFTTSGYLRDPTKEP